MKKFMKLIKNEDGQALILAALVMAVLIGFAALVVDLGTVYVTKAKLQNAADAAALAGAQDLGTINDPIETAKDYGVLNGIIDRRDTTAEPSYGGDPNKIKVLCYASVSFTFAKVLNLNRDGIDLSARAVAKKNSQWGGEALPFINLAFNYSDSDVTAWTKVGPGIKGTITDFYTRNSDSDDPYFEVDYTNGITITPGYSNGEKGLDDSKLSDGLAKVLTLADMGIKKVYIFSLRSDIIQTLNSEGGTFMVNNNHPTTIGGLKNGDVIDSDQLVLIECQFDDCKWANQHDIELTYLNNVYDLGNNDPAHPLPDFPTDYVSHSGGPSRLVE